MNEFYNGISLDAFAETNPAFCTLLLSAYVSGYVAASESALPIPLIPLVLPIVMSGDLDASFSYTTQKTGLSRWISKSPSILFNLDQRIENTLDMTRMALQFGLHLQILHLDDKAAISDLIAGDAIPRLKKLGFERMGANAHKFGAWLGALKSAAGAYNLLGLEV